MRPARPVLHAMWSFQTVPDACTALAKAGPASLTVGVPADGPIRLTLSLPDDPPDHPAARFAGPAGHWQIAGTHAGRHTASFLLPRGEASLGRILMLLSGGVLAVEPPAQVLPAISLPESGTAGATWFACARRSVNGA
jgi:hypothetical protein